MIKKLLHILFYWLPTILWMVLIFQGSAAPPTHVPGGKSIDFLSHKIAHFGEYLILYFLWLRSLRSVERVRTLRRTSEPLYQGSETPASPAGRPYRKPQVATRSRLDRAGLSDTGVKSLAPVLALFLSVFYAFSDEFHQLFVSGREGKLWDTAVDIFAVLVGWKIAETKNNLTI